MDIAEARTAASRALFRAILTYVDRGTERETEMLGLIGNGGEIAAAKAAGYDGLRLIVDNPVHGDRSVERRQGSAHTSDAGLSMADIVTAIALGATACSTVRCFC